MPRWPAITLGAAGACCSVWLAAMALDLTGPFIYFPSRYPEGEWERQARAGAQEVWVKAADGTRLNCAWYPYPEASFATLFLHGNGGNITHRVDHALRLREAGSAALILDYRGYGKSEGKPHEPGLHADAEAAYHELRRMGYEPSRIVINGESLGTAVAARLAGRVACAGLVLESPLISLRKMAGKVLPLVGPLLAKGFDTAGAVQDVRVPVLVIHGDADEIVPFSHGQTVFKRAREPKQFWAVPGGHHNDLLLAAGPEYVRRLRRFYGTLAR